MKNAQISLSDYNLYHPPFFLPGGHLQTIVPALTRKVRLPKPYRRERINTPDEDFLDLDWLESGHKKLLILCHGLEGSSDRPYILGMARHFFNHQFDVLAWNFRGCSGEINRAKRMYHSGATDDLAYVIDHAKRRYDELYLIGFSLGGNLSLKYLGEKGANTPIKKAVTFSVPLDLHDGVTLLDQGFNQIYVRRFLNTLKKKVLLKHAQYPDLIDLSPLSDISTVYDFDDTYTSRLHGFHGAADYYYQCSSIRFVQNIMIPTQVINAANDPMIGKIAISKQPFETNENVQFLLSKSGGHCGFSGYNNRVLWSEEMALRFIKSQKSH